VGNVWDADVALKDADAARLIERQFPQLAPVELAVLGAGWDNTAYLVNGELVFRFPRREIAAGFIEREARILPMLAPHLPLPVPAPTFVGEPADGYPYPFAGYPWIPGMTACRVRLTENGRAALASSLGGFLRALHSIPVDEETRVWAPGDEIGRTDILRKAPRTAARAREVADALPGLPLAAAAAFAEAAAATPPHPGPACWVHGDFYARHLLLDEARQPCGVIDWGDVHLGDPALDLSIAYSFLPPAARDRFWSAYGEVDAPTETRARFRALHYGLLLTDYGASVGDEPLHLAGQDALIYAMD
jgi:aminoglycoside phosphotransferase (APT) family kinase protein